MANQIETKKITTLTENTDLSDTDQFPFGAGGGSGLRRIKWINIWNKILAKMRAAIIVNNCTTTVAGYALDARQGKIIQDEVSELNTNIGAIYQKIIVENVTVNISAGVDYSYIAYKPGYVLVAVHGTTFKGVYVSGVADTGSNYAIFFNTAGQQQADLTLNLTWIKLQ